MEMLSDTGSIPVISTIGMALARNGRSSFIARDLGSQASSIKASASFQISFQTRFRLSQTTETGDETGVFLMVLGMKSEDFDSFEPGESEQS